MTCTIPAPCIMAYDDAIADRHEEKENLLAALDDDGTLTSAFLTALADEESVNATLTEDLLAAGLLSDQVLSAVCAREPFFSDAQFTTIIVHNSPVTRQVWQHVYPKIGWAGPNAEVMLSAQRTDTLRTVRVIERELEKAGTLRSRAISDLLHSYVDRDSIPDSTHITIHWLADSLIGKEWRMLAVGTALSLDTLTWARDILENIDLENGEDTAFYELHDLFITLREDTLTWFNMDSTQRSLITGIAQGQTLMRGYAETVLTLLGDTFLTRIPEHYEPPSAKMGEEEESEEENPTLPVRPIEERLAVYPNPFTNSFHVDYVLRDEAQEVIVEVFDLVGCSVKTVQERNVRSGRLTVDLGECLGIYVLRVVADGRQVHQQKVVCLKP